MSQSVRRWLVTGKVQGVGYRYFTRREAESLDLVGSVRNLDGGAVEILAAGEPDALTELARRLKKGPPAGRVDELVKTAAPASLTASTFRITF